MIVGNGLIANLFKDSDKNDVVFFASGVSNSSETDLAQFKREEDLVLDTLDNHPEKLFIYFSTCSIYDSSKTNSPYVLHKLRMEEIIKNNTGKHMILRVSNAVGKGGNPNLLINYLVRSVKTGEKINVHTKATRNFIDSEDVKEITLDLIEENNFNRIVNIAYPQNYSVIEILEILENYFKQKLNLNLIKEGSHYAISIPETENYFRKNNLENKEVYLCKILEKYYT